MSTKIPNDLYLGGFGVHAPWKPLREAVEVSKQWLAKYITPRKTLNKKANSRFLKTYIEHWYGDWISTGAVIQAAIELGYDYKRNGPDAIFNMSIVKAKAERGR